MNYEFFRKGSLQKRNLVYREITMKYWGMVANNGSKTSGIWGKISLSLGNCYLQNTDIYTMGFKELEFSCILKLSILKHYSLSD